MENSLEQALALLSVVGTDGDSRSAQHSGIDEFRRRNAGWLRSPILRNLGIRHAGDTAIGERVIAIYVAREALRQRRSDTAIIPEYIRLPGGNDRVPVALFPFDPVVLHGGGTSVGGGIRRADGNEVGTLGCFVERRGAPGKRYLLSNAHVLAWTLVKRPEVGDSVVDSATGREIARLADWTPLVSGTGHPNPADAAIAELTDANIVTSHVEGIGTIAGQSYQALEVGSRVRLRGAGSSAIVEALVRATSQPLRQRYSMAGIGRVECGLNSLVMVEPVAGMSFTRPGHSGSVWMNDRNEVVGLHVAGNTASAYFSPIDIVLDALDVEIPRNLAATIMPFSTLTAFANTAIPLGPNALDVMARTLWGEARGEEAAGIRAVAAVIVNRAKAGFRGKNIAAVCTWPLQFSCWNQNGENAKNRKSMLAVSDADKDFRLCMQVAQEAAAGTMADPTDGARFYHRKELHTKWSAGKQPSATIGRHVFFNNVE